MSLIKKRYGVPERSKEKLSQMKSAQGAALKHTSERLFGSVQGKSSSFAWLPGLRQPAVIVGLLSSAAV
jgi:hypothetical protein